MDEGQGARAKLSSAYITLHSWDLILQDLPGQMPKSVGVFCTQFAGLNYLGNKIKQNRKITYYQNAIETISIIGAFYSVLVFGLNSNLIA